MAKVEGKLEGVDEVEKPKLVMGVPQLKLYLLILGRLTEDQSPSVETTEGADTSSGLSNGIHQCFRFCFSAMGSSKMVSESTLSVFFGGYL